MGDDGAALSVGCGRGDVSKSTTARCDITVVVDIVSAAVTDTNDVVGPCMSDDAEVREPPLGWTVTGDS